MSGSRDESIALRLQSMAVALGDLAAREARQPSSTSGADLAREHSIQLAGMALTEAGVDARTATPIAALVFSALAGYAESTLRLVDADRARAERSTAYRAEELAKERADREAARAADELEARRLGREWRRRGGQGLNMDRVVQLVTTQHARLRDHEASVRAGWLDEDQRARLA